MIDEMFSYRRINYKCSAIDIVIVRGTPERGAEGASVPPASLEDNVGNNSAICRITSNILT